MNGGDTYVQTNTINLNVNEDKSLRREDVCQKFRSIITKGKATGHLLGKKECVSIIYTKSDTDLDLVDHLIPPSFFKETSPFSKDDQEKLKRVATDCKQRLSAMETELKSQNKSNLPVDFYMECIPGLRDKFQEYVWTSLADEDINNELYFKSLYDSPEIKQTQKDNARMKQTGKDIEERHQVSCAQCQAEYPAHRCPCRSVYYCSQTCQRLHWREHKKHPVHVQYNR